MSTSVRAANKDIHPSSQIQIVGRAAGILFGAMTQLVFLLVAWNLFQFLRFGAPSVGETWLLRDILLALQFAIVHSLLLHPSTKRRITRWFPAELYGCLFCVATMISLSLLFVAWRRSPGVLWDFVGAAKGCVLAGFYFSWFGLFFSLAQSGLGYQTGLVPWWNWMRGQKSPPRKLCETGIYAVLRHPVYLCFLGLIWCTPTMTWDHVVLTSLWTNYVFLGSHLKDERIAYYLGETYRNYQARVAGYPFILWGPLGKRRV